MRSDAREPHVGFGVEAESLTGTAPTVAPIGVLPSGVSCSPTNLAAPDGNPATLLSCSTGTMPSSQNVSFSATVASGIVITRDFQIGPGRYVALGDSYSSGQGTGNELGYVAGPKPKVINTNGEGGGGDGLRSLPLGRILRASRPGCPSGAALGVQSAVGAGHCPWLQQQ